MKELYSSADAADLGRHIGVPGSLVTIRPGLSGSLLPAPAPRCLAGLARTEARYGAALFQLPPAEANVRQMLVNPLTSVLCRPPGSALPAGHCPAQHAAVTAWPASRGMAVLGAVKTKTAPAQAGP